MAKRCGLPNAAGNHASLCCRVDGHPGDCHRHISTRVVRARLHTLLQRATGGLIGCSEGAAMDGEVW